MPSFFIVMLKTYGIDMRTRISADTSGSPISGFKKYEQLRNCFINDGFIKSPNICVVLHV